MSLLYTKFKIFHYKDKLDSLPQNISEISPPIHIRIKPTNVCGHNCWYCAYRADNLQLGKDMVKKDYIPKDKMLEIMDDIIEMDVKAVTFSGGGDPFYYQYLLDAVKKLAQSPVKFASLTNGARLEGDLAEIFAHNATWLRVSIDGWDDVSYAQYRGVKEGEFTKILRNMRNFKKMGGRCPLGVSLIIDKSNAEHIYEFSSQLKDIGVDSIKMSACVVDDDVAENNKYHENLSKPVTLQIQKVIDDLADDKFKVYNAYHELDARFKKDYTWCPYSQILPIIGADLNIYPCQDKAYNLTDGLIGSIKNTRLKDFWCSDKNNFFKINTSINSNHHCVAMQKNQMILEYLDTDKEHMAFV